MTLPMNLLRRLLACLLSWYCLAALPAAEVEATEYPLSFLPDPDPVDGQTFRVLCLHDVRDNLRASFASFPDGFAIETRTLVDLFEWLRANDYHPVSLAQIVAARNGGAPLPPRPVLLTFDDGFASMYTKVFPLLKQFGYPAVAAIVTKWVDAPPDARIRLSAKLEVPRNTFLNWDQVKEMADSGLVEIASHTHDLHRGVIGNPQGNELPAAAARAYLARYGRYEDDAAYRARIADDLRTSRDLIEQYTGRRPRALAWPYGAHNRDTDEVALSLGFDIMLTLEPGPNTPSVPLTLVRRSLVSYDVTVASIRAALRQPMTYHGKLHPVQRIVQVDLDYIYDPDPAQQERNLSLLIDRMKDMAPSAVYLQAFADPKGDGDITSVYFPNRHLPVRADLFNRVAWQLKTRANTAVYAWLPVLSFSVPRSNPAYGREVKSAVRKPGERGLGHPHRLSPYDPIARRVIGEIYEDLAKHAMFDGILFHDDAVLDDTEDASDPALRTYAQWGLPADVAAIRASPELSAQWSRRKTQHLIDFTLELAGLVQSYQNNRDMLTVRNLYAEPVFNPQAESWYAQNLPDFLKHYDYVALMAMPYMEDAGDPQDWLRQLVAKVDAQGGLGRTIFELQARDWRRDAPVPSETLLAQMQSLRTLGAIHYGYYPDDFITNHPDSEIIRPAMSLQAHLQARRLTEQQAATRRQLLQGLYQPASR